MDKKYRLTTLGLHFQTYQSAQLILYQPLSFKQPLSQEVDICSPSFYFLFLNNLYFEKFRFSTYKMAGKFEFESKLSEYRMKYKNI